MCRYTTILFCVVLIGFGVAAAELQCGQRKVQQQAKLILGDTRSTAGKWPWHVAITRRTDNVFEVICGGSIIDKYTILTAAHCLHTEYGVIAKSRLQVHAAWTRPFVTDPNTRSYFPDEFLIHPNYRPNQLNNDLALIKLENEIEMSDYIQPACICSTIDDERQIVGKTGTVVGFGINQGNKVSDYLLEAQVPVVDRWTCLESNRAVFGQVLTRSMLCAGEKNGIGPCNGDSGGGLVFESGGVWCVRGVVSFTTGVNGTTICDPNEYVLYTDVTKYKDWLGNSTNALEYSGVQKKICGFGEECEAVSSKFDEYNQNIKVEQTSFVSQPLQCGKRKVSSLFFLGDAEVESWPWHTALFHNNRRSFEYKCGGTILGKNLILTAAHCVMTPNGPIAPQRLLVQVGRSRLYVASQRAQDHEAHELIIHPEYEVNKLTHNIALIRLATDITYTDYIQPICLWNRGEDLQSIVGYSGTVIGFGYLEGDEKNMLHQLDLQVVDSYTCIQSNREVFATQLTGEMFCAGNRNSVGLCNDDGGGGMFFRYEDTWYIRGIVSFGISRGDALICDPKMYTVFTDVAKYLGWIATYMQPENIKAQ